MVAIPSPRFVRRAAAALPGWATAGAWFFIAFSLAAVGWAAVRQWGDTSGTTALYGGDGHGAFALTYGGVPGLLLALGQLAAVGAAAFASVLPQARLARLGHRVLMGWAALWTLDLAWLAASDPRFESFGQAALMSALMACTVYRAFRRPARRIAAAPLASTSPPPPPAAEADTGDGLPDEPDASPALSIPAPSVPSRLSRARATTKRLAARARPAMKSMINTARRGVARLQNGWRTTSA